MQENLISDEFILLTNGRKVKSSFIGRKRVQQMYAIGGLFMDLLISDFIGFDDNDKIIIKNQMKNIEHEPAKRLYSLIQATKPLTFKKWMSKFNIPSKERKYIYSGFNNTTDNIPVLQQKTVEKIRAELLEEGAVSEETIALTLLLSASKTIKDYFSKFEINQLNNRIDEFQKNHPSRWKEIQRINKEIENMDIIILTSAILV